MAVAPPIASSGGYPMYGRRYQLTIDMFQGTGFDVSDLHITFKIDKHLQNICQFAEITIYNLRPETETAIFTQGKSVTLNAGYEQAYFGTIFKGSIVQPLRGREEDGVTEYLRLVCIGGDRLNLGIAQNIQFGAGQLLRDIAQQVCLTSLNAPFTVNIDPHLGLSRTQRAKSITGKVHSVLRDFARGENAHLWVDDDEVNISSLTADVAAPAAPGVYPDLNFRSGMIGIPHQQDFGVSVRTLMRPDIKLNTFVHLNNKDVIEQQIDPLQLDSIQYIPPFDTDGLYRVIGMVINGDTRGQDWYMDLETVSQLGAAPAMISLPGLFGQ